MRRLLIALSLIVPALAQAQDLKDRFNARIALTGMFLTEQQSGDLIDSKREVGSFSLAYADLRLQLDGRRLPGKFELHIDGRVRITGELDQAQLDTNASGYTSRGYLAGREYELRQAYFMRRGDNADFAMGRQYVLEADMMKLDGVRFWYRFKKPHWDFSAFAGGYPNPYSRSLTTDYQGANGYYGSPFGGGMDVAYNYDKVWGSIAAAVIYLGGNDDGGPITLMSGSVDATPHFSTETPRSFINWVGYERFTSWLDLYHNMVLDMSGAGGVQLTRLNAFATVRAGKHLTFQVGFDHMSSIGIEMFLNGLLLNRTYLTANGMLLLPSITNNLIVARTAHEQARVNVDAHWGMTSVWAEGRVRIRSLVNNEDPQFTDRPSASIVPLAGDATFGVRDLGSLKKLRLGLWYTFLHDYRALSYIVGFNLGRSFFDDRLSFDFEFLYAKTKDDGNNGAFAMPAPAIPLNCNSPGPTYGTGGYFDQTCYGTKDGSEYEAGITFTGNPWKHWFMMLDYRVVANQATVVSQPAGAPLILTHALLLRIEARY